MFSLTPTSPLGLWRIAEAAPERVALIAPDGERRTFAELARRADRLVHGLRARGLERGDVVAAVLPNGAAMIELHMAALEAGFYLTPINHHLTGPEIAYILDDSGARALVCSERYGEACGDAVERLERPPRRFVTDGALAGFEPYSALTEGVPSTRPEDRSAGTTMHYTSGTTGRPKGVRRPLRGLDPDLVAEAFPGFLALFGIAPHGGGVHLAVSPLYHTAVMVFSTTSIHCGHTVVLMDRWTPGETLRLIERHRVTTSHMVPTQFHRLLALPDEVRAAADVSSLTHVIHSAAPCPIDVKRRMLEWWGPVIFEYYAATEGGGTLVAPTQWLERPGTVGLPWPNSEVVIEDDAGERCPAGTPGTVWMRMAQEFEYHRDEAKTRAGQRRGFFTVGDVGYLDEGGYLFLCDRRADMIIAGGVNIYPAEIESVLFAHPAVADCAVFGIPDADWGEQVKAAIEPAPGFVGGPELADEILAFCRPRLAGYKWPRSIDFVAELPRDPTGKLAKRKLRDPYWAGRDRAI